MSSSRPLDPEEEAAAAAAAQAEQRDLGGSDDSSTSSQWSQEFSILGAPGPQRVHQESGPDGPASPSAGDPACSIGAPSTPGKPTAAAYSRMQSSPAIVAHGHCPAEVDYRSNASVKPPYSYATSICMAMQASKRSKITSSYIYQWITDNFCYYRHADPTWQNSIRHNSSLNKCFIKVPRSKDEPGKGGFWRIDPQYAERSLSGAYKKRRMGPVQINPASQNRLRQQAAATAAGSTGASEDGTDPRSSEGTMSGSWERSGQKRKRGVSKATRRSSSPSLCVDEPRDAGPSKGPFDWDASSDSALRGESSSDGEDPIMTDGAQGSAEAPPLAGGRDLSDSDEETFSATAFSETPWPEDEDRSDFSSSSTVSSEQSFDSGDSLGMDASSRMDASS